MIQHHLHNKPRSTAGKLFLPMLGVVILTLTASISGGLHEAVAAAPQESFRRAFRVTVERVIAYREAGEFSEAERLLNALEVMADSGELSDQETRAVRQFRVTQIAGQSQIDQQRMFSERVESLSNTALNSEGTDAQESDNEDEQAAEEYLPIVVIQPRYPTKALRENVEGWVSVSFTVNEAGSVEDPVVLESSPAGVFDEASLTAASRFKFNPRVVDGEAVQTPDVRYVFRFSVDE